MRFSPETLELVREALSENVVSDQENQSKLRTWQQVKNILRNAGFPISHPSETDKSIKKLGMMACGIVSSPIIPVLPPEEAYQKFIEALQEYSLPNPKRSRIYAHSDPTARHQIMMKQIKELFNYENS